MNWDSFDQDALELENIRGAQTESTMRLEGSGRWSSLNTTV